MIPDANAGRATTSEPPSLSAMVPCVQRPQRADARRNRLAVLAAARALVAGQGRDFQMEDVAARAGVGVGTVYRTFPNKSALLSAMVVERFADMARIAREYGDDHDPGRLFDVLRQATDAVAEDRGFQLAAMGWDGLDWSIVDPEREALQVAMQPLLDRACAAGLVRPDLSMDDVGVLMCAVTATMYFKPDHDWHRFRDIVLAGLSPNP